MQYIGLLDCNNFFVSCERLFRPDVRTKPAVVLSSNDGCVVARSAEVKALGIPMGIPYFKVKQELGAAETAVFSSNFTLYRDISRRVMDTLRAEVDVMEQYSVDEAFFSLTGAPPAVESELQRIKELIETQVGVPVSVGAAATKTIAKYASEVGKQGDGISLLTNTKWQAIQATVPVGAVWGIGGKVAKSLREVGVTTVADLVAADPALLRARCGIGVVRIQREVAGERVFHLGSESALPQSVMSTRSLATPATTLAVATDAIAYHAAAVAADLRTQRAAAQALTVLLRPSRHSDWALHGRSREVVLTQPTNDTRVIVREAVRAAAAVYEPRVPYKKVGVIAGLIQPAAARQDDLFSAPLESAADEKLMQALDTLTERFGREAIAVGRLPRSPHGQPARAHVSPAYTTRWTDIPLVQA
jgi:DNA polymerase V